MNWINCLLEACSEAETPRSYLWWAGISTIAAVCGPNVYINRGGVYKLSPNTFVMLMGESGLGKGLPIWLSKKLVNEVGNTRVIAGRNTIASILKELANSYTEKETGKPKFKDSRGFIVSGEFATLIQRDEEALPAITELYDTHWMDDWKNTTKTSGIDTLSKVNVTLFGGSTPEHFNNVVPESDVRGGFVGRILMVYEEKRAKINPLSDTEAELELPIDELTKHLKMISQISGPFKWSNNETRLYWEDWYTDIRSRKVHDPTGAVNRLPDNVLKVAMCLSMATTADLRIHKSQLEEAIDRCMSLSSNVDKVLEGKGKSALGEATKLVLKALWSSTDKTLKKSELLRKYYGHFDSLELDRIIMTLEGATIITSIPINGEVIIKMLPSAIERIADYMETRMK